jgi:hypothetical protein
MRGAFRRGKRTIIPDRNTNGVVYDVKSFLDLKIVDGRL